MSTTVEVNTAPLPPAADFADRLMAARVADHRAHCAPCREQAAQAEVRDSEYGASIRRRDRLTLGPRTASTAAVTA